MNAKNKMHNSSSHCRAVSGEVQVIEKLYDEKQPVAAATTIEIDNEKSSIDRERNGFYDYECCTENSLYQSSRIYAKARTVSEQNV